MSGLPRPLVSRTRRCRAPAAAGRGRSWYISADDPFEE